MTHRNVHLACLVSLLAVTSAIKEQARWSRQLSSYTSDIGDWVPLRGPIEREPEIPLPQIKRQAVAEPRILSEPFPSLSRPTGFNSDSFSSRNYFNAQPNRQLYLQSVPAVPSAPQNYLTDQGFGQNIRFGLTPNNYPLTQGFVNQQYFDHAPPPPKPGRQQLPTANKVTFSHSLGPVSMPGKVYLNHQVLNAEVPKFVDGYRAENATNEFAFVPKTFPQSLQKIKFDNGEKGKLENAQHSKSERGEEVQLLYVPIEQLNRNPPNYRGPITKPYLVNPEGLSRPIAGKPSLSHDYQKKPLESLPEASYFTDFKDFNTRLTDSDQVSKYTTISTPFVTHAPATVKPRKLKPHQPPLAIFLTRDANKNSPVKVGDVLSSLKNAATIAVLDSVNPLNAPKVFIGPSNLPPPDNFAKFELPYLSNIEHGDNKLKQLPFFVAPLSYNTPNGFAKIPFPSPHIGSVVINSQIKETSPSFGPAKPISPPVLNTNNNYNFHSQSVPNPPIHSNTQKPTFSYYTTAAPKGKPENYNSNYYSFEPQTVSSIRPSVQLDTKGINKPGSFFISNAGPQYNAQNFANFPEHYNFKASEAIDNDFQREPQHTSPAPTTSSTTTKPPSTFPSPLLETHNPYSINQAFHFSTPLDYHNYFDDIKQPYVAPGTAGYSPSPQSPSSLSPSSLATKPDEVVTEKSVYTQQSSPVSYTPEIHYDSIPNKYPSFDSNEHISSKPELNSQQVDSVTLNKYNTNDDITDSNNKYKTDTTIKYTDPTVNYYNTGLNNNDYSANIDTSDNSYKTAVESPVNKYVTNQEIPINKNEYNLNSATASSVQPEYDSEIKSSSVSIDNGQKYDEFYNFDVSSDKSEVSSTTSTTTPTTTRRTTIRPRGRPRYTTTPRSDSNESTSKVVVTRRPLRERRPLPNRPRYEPNKITTEKPARKPLDSSESTTKSPRTRPRGRIHYRPSDEDTYDRKKTHNSKEEDLAYQRDVLHQNYPVTLMERMSTVDIEAMTEPTAKESSEKLLDPVTEIIDTENAYTNEKPSINEHEGFYDASSLPTFNLRSTAQTDTPYVTKLSSTSNNDYFYQSSKSSNAPVESTSFDEFDDSKEDIYVKHSTSPIPKPISYATEAPEKESTVYDYSTTKPKYVTTSPESEVTKAISQESQETEVEENVVQTTPSYNRVRVRPGVVRQYHRPTTTESSKKKKPSVVVTYRPALDKRRTTMRIDEIEADLKTKQVHFRHDQEHKHPVYKPEATESSFTTSTTESTVKRSQFRRRRPSYSYTTTSTEATSTKRVYEVKNRFRGRRPAEKVTEKTDTQSEATTSTTRLPLQNRYSHRPRLSERYTKKPEPETEVEDQESNYSINRPKYVEPESDQWSPKITNDSFKPYNPNDIMDEQKLAITERRSDKLSELDIITARNEPDEILLTVTPASNNRINKRVPDIPPTLEALVEQSKMTTSDAGDSMSTFESMLEEVMKNLDEQDQDEYNSNVMKHKGGEIGEIPPERIISSGDNYAPKSTTPLQDATATDSTTVDDYTQDDEQDIPTQKQRRGFWKKVAVRPVTTESIEFAESQYYTNTVNRLGKPVKDLKMVHEKFEDKEKPKVTTYKPKFEFMSNFFTSDTEASLGDITSIDYQKIVPTKETVKTETDADEDNKTTVVDKETQTISPGDLDLGTGSPDPTIDNLYITTPTEPMPTSAFGSTDAFSLMKYLFGDTSDDDKHKTTEENNNEETTKAVIAITTEQPKLATTESTFIPEEITTPSTNDDSYITEISEFKKLNASEIITKIESTSESSFMDPANVLSTSMSTEVSHETEICFRGKCIKTSKDIL